MKIFVSFMCIGIGLVSLSQISIRQIQYLLKRDKSCLKYDKYKVYDVSVVEAQESKSFRTYLLCTIHIMNSSGVSSFAIRSGYDYQITDDFSEEVGKNDSLSIYHVGNLHKPIEVYNISKRLYIIREDYDHQLFTFFVTFCAGGMFLLFGIAIHFTKGYRMDY